MSTVRSEKEAVVAEIRAKLSGASAVIITEYRGISVTGLATLRLALREHGGIEGLDALLVGPTAITFIDGDVAAVAKTLKDFSKTNPNLVLQGGAVDGKTVSASYIDVLASLPSQEAMLGQFAGLLLALPRNMAYGLKALIDQKEAA
jgi:large subunit ribosomal protein L10